jgi:hypothetical protein
MGQLDWINWQLTQLDWMSDQLLASLVAMATSSISPHNHFYFQTLLPLTRRQF